MSKRIWRASPKCREKKKRHQDFRMKRAKLQTNLSRLSDDIFTLTHKKKLTSRLY